MQVWILDVNKFTKVNGLKEVTNPIMFDSGNVPTVDGLFSTEIFGVSTRDRKETFAYIDLGGKYLTPKAYISLRRLNRNFESIVFSTKKYSISPSGELVHDEENGGTGLDWLYKNWEKIKFPKNKSHQRSERVDLITQNKKDVLFVDKFPVIPAFYRDVNISSTDKNPRVQEINDEYARIIRNVNVVKDSTNMDFVIASVRGKIQSGLVDIYNMLKEKVQGKNGYIRRSLMGKSIQYSSRIVITAAPYGSESVKDQQVNYYYTGVPLSHVCSDFTPFMIYWLTRWFKNNAENQKNSYQVMDDKGNVQIVKLDNPEAYYNSDYIESALDRFVQNPFSRFDPIELPISKEELNRIGKKGPVYMRFYGRVLPGQITTAPKETDGSPVNRALTWTDLLYQAAVDVTSDKHVWITRYPMLDYFGFYTTRIAVISTRKTIPMIIGSKYYDHYPAIDPSIKKSDLDAAFRDTVNIAPIYLPAMGADFDGDQVTAKPVFSIEANEECEKRLQQKSNVLTIEGKGNRKLGNEAVQTMYAMTSFR